MHNYGVRFADGFKSCPEGIPHFAFSILHFALITQTHSSRELFSS